MPTAEDLATFYRDHYRAVYKRVLTPRPHHVLRAFRAARIRHQWLQELVPNGTGVLHRAPPAVLDFGSGGGEFLALAQSREWLTQGVEPNDGYREYSICRYNLTVHPSLECVTSPVNLVTMFHVLEHMPDPVQALRQVAERLVPGGCVAIEVPNLLSPVEHPVSRFHYAHVVYFTGKTLELCGRLAGLRPITYNTSADAGNLWAVFQKRELHRQCEIEEIINLTVACHAEQVLATEDKRTRLAYYTNPKTLLRVASRLSWSLRDRLQGALDISPVPRNASSDPNG
jgi:SAM-dependent methyltransferase